MVGVTTGGLGLGVIEVLLVKGPNTVCTLFGIVMRIIGGQGTKAH
jgi:hypothetical protein